MKVKLSYGIEKEKSMGSRMVELEKSGMQYLAKERTDATWGNASFSLRSKEYSFSPIQHEDVLLYSKGGIIKDETLGFDFISQEQYLAALAIRFEGNLATILAIDSTPILPSKNKQKLDEHRVPSYGEIRAMRDLLEKSKQIYPNHLFLIDYKHISNDRTKELLEKQGIMSIDNLEMELDERC